MIWNLPYLTIFNLIFTIFSHSKFTIFNPEVHVSFQVMRLDFFEPEAFVKRGISPTRPRQKAMEDLKAKSAGGFWDHLMDFMGISWGYN